MALILRSVQVRGKAWCGCRWRFDVREAGMSPQPVFSRNQVHDFL